MIALSRQSRGRALAALSTEFNLPLEEGYGFFIVAFVGGTRWLYVTLTWILLPLCSLLGALMVLLVLRGEVRLALVALVAVLLSSVVYALALKSSLLVVSRTGDRFTLVVVTHFTLRARRVIIDETPAATALEPSFVPVPYARMFRVVAGDGSQYFIQMNRARQARVEGVLRPIASQGSEDAQGQ